MRAGYGLALRATAEAVKAKALSGSPHAAAGAADLAFRSWRHNKQLVVGFGRACKLFLQKKPLFSSGSETQTPPLSFLSVWPARKNEKPPCCLSDSRRFLAYGSKNIPAPVIQHLDCHPIARAHKGLFGLPRLNFL